MGLASEDKPAAKYSGTGRITRFSINYPTQTDIDIKTLNDIRNLDENVNLATNSIADSVAGNGLEIFIEGRNRDNSPLSEKQKETAKDICRQFAYDVDIDEFNRETVAEYVSVGVSFSEKIFAENSGGISRELVNLARLPIDDMWRVKMPEKTGGPDFEYALQGVTDIRFTPDNLILWRFNRTSAADWFGRGICWYLAQEKSYSLTFDDNTTKSYRVPPLYVVLWALQDDMRLATHNMAPKTFINAPGMSDNWVTENAETIQKMNAGENLLLNAAKGLELYTSNSDPRFRLEALLGWYDQLLLRSVQAPSMAMYSKEGYSGIFAEQVLSVFARKIISLRRYHARKLEREIFSQLLSQNGIDPRYVRPRVYWRPDIKMISQLQDYVALFTNDTTAADFTVEERREIYRRYGAPISSTPPAKAKVVDGVIDGKKFSFTVNN